MRPRLLQILGCLPQAVGYRLRGARGVGEVTQAFNIEDFSAARMRRGDDVGKVLMQTRCADGGHAVGTLALFRALATTGPPAADAFGFRASIGFDPALNRAQRVLPRLTIQHIVSLHILSERLVPRPRVPTLLHGTVPGRCLTLALLPLLSERVSHPALLHRDDTLDGH